MGDLSRNFSLWEAEKSNTAIRLGIENKVPAHIVPNVKAVANMILQPCRDHFGIPIQFNGGNSWYRCLELNRALKSKDNSQHITGHAVDFEIAGVSNFDIATWIMQNLDFDQLLMEYFVDGEPSSGWVHCSFVSLQSNRKQVLRFDGKRYKPGLID